MPCSYLLQHHSGPFVDPESAKFRVANLCASYLTFQCFDPLDEISIAEAVAKGQYSFQEYATVNWFHHVHSLVTRGQLANNDKILKSEDTITLLRRHRFQRSLDCDSSNDEDIGPDDLHKIECAHKRPDDYDIRDIYKDQSRPGNKMCLLY